MGNCSGICGNGGVDQTIVKKCPEEEEKEKKKIELALE